MAFNGNIFKVSRGLPAWAWSGEGECELCHAFVPQLVRCVACSTPWVCDECAEDHECK